MHQEGEYYIDHPPEVVFEYMNQPSNAAEVSPTLENSEGVRVADNGGWVVRAEYEVAGGIADGELILQPEAFEPEEKIRYTLDDDISGYVEWRFEEEGDGTMFTYEAEYTVEIPVPSFFMETVGRQITQRELDAIISNLRTQVDEYAD